MSRKIVIGLALAIVLVGGAFIGAQADCGCMSNSSPLAWNSPQGPFPCACSPPANRDLDVACPGAYYNAPAAPWVMSAPSF